jgi:serine protease Do
MLPAILLAAIFLWPSPGRSQSGSELFGSRLFVKIARQSKKSVVNISTTDRIRGWSLPRLDNFLGSRRSRDRDDEKNFFDRFAPDFGSQGRREPRHSLGSGFIVDPRGYILTNYHVIERAGTIKVTLEDQKEYEAQVVGTDALTDIALLKIKAGRLLPTNNLGDSNGLEVGEWVMAIGSPFGLAHTVTVGVVSAKGRVIGSGPFDDFIQTDAYINVGNSGGPLVNARGEIIGINSAIVAESLGVGFAIPINVAKGILSDLKTFGSARRGWMGVAVREVAPSLAKNLGLRDNKGAFVFAVTTAGPAARAGVRKGDVIVEFNGRPIKDSRQFPTLVATARPGSRARLKLLREGRPHEVAVSLRAKDDGWLPEDRAGRRLGFQVTPVTDRMARRMGVDPRAGVVVTSVEEGSLAQAAGVQEGDVVLEINRKPVQGMHDYRRMLHRALEHNSILLLIRRNRNSIFVALNQL